ncbi:hypothetical protein AAF712_009344 [Marasmius tenuissimus]|uniref:Uncharacterized protein n=1 Tax=Marasmius tenuissimus TaxID=585030 RepID=A0ABR2ZRN6_9AGAR
MESDMVHPSLGTLSAAHCIQDIEQLQSMIQKSETALTRADEELEEFQQAMDDHLQQLQEKAEQNSQNPNSENVKSFLLFNQFHAAAASLLDLLIRQNPCARGLQDLLAQANACVSLMRQECISREQDRSRLRHVTSRLTEYEGHIAYLGEQLADLYPLGLKLSEYEACIIALSEHEDLPSTGVIADGDIFARLVKIQSALLHGNQVQAQQAIALDTACDEIAKLNRDNGMLEDSLQHAQAARVSTRERRKLACRFVWTMIAVLLAVYAIHARG